MIYLNSAALSFIDMGHFVLLPLFYSTPIPSGGLGLDPYQIGMSLGIFGFVNAIVQASFLGPLIRKFGARKMYIICFPAHFVCVALYPIMRHLAQGFGRVNNVVIGCMVVQLTLHTVVFSSFGIFIYVLVDSTSSNMISKVPYKLCWHSMCLIVDMWERLLASLRCLTLECEPLLLPSSLRSSRYLPAARAAIWYSIY